MFTERIEICFVKGTKKKLEKIAKQERKLVSDLKREALSDLLKKYERKTTSN